MREEPILLSEKVANQSFFEENGKLDTLKLREYANESFKSYFEKQGDAFSTVSKKDNFKEPSADMLAGGLQETTNFAQKVSSILGYTWETSRLTLEETETLLSFLDWDNLQKKQ